MVVYYISLVYISEFSSPGFLTSCLSVSQRMVRESASQEASRVVEANRGPGIATTLCPTAATVPTLGYKHWRNTGCSNCSAKLI